MSVWQCLMTLLVITEDTISTYTFILADSFFILFIVYNLALGLLSF